MGQTGTDFKGSRSTGQNGHGEVTLPASQSVGAAPGSNAVRGVTQQEGWPSHGDRELCLTVPLPWECSNLHPGSSITLSPRKEPGAGWPQERELKSSARRTPITCSLLPRRNAVLPAPLAQAGGTPAAACVPREQRNGADGGNGALRVTNYPKEQQSAPGSVRLRARTSHSKIFPSGSSATHCSLSKQFWPEEQLCLERIEP
ncbi:uncharacterized protein LOC109370724 [Meleagris gallopavo]|uniref:uncharacterized protein LOC109370724 n=1 Tax=Meleagris gallopavo TaxID=9103 RepID=UPI000940166A|nr:uncharacterized protein LOC109370724 [Meleagris gallopavo]